METSLKETLIKEHVHPHEQHDYETKSEPGSKPVRSTRNVRRIRYRDDIENAQSLSLKRVRTTQASNLTRLCNKAKKAISEFRSKATLTDFQDNINEALAMLNETNSLYMKTLKVSSDKNTALIWMQDRHEAAEELLTEIHVAKSSGKVRSNTTCSEYSQSVTSEVSRLSQLDEMRDVTETNRVLNDHRNKLDSDTRKTPLAKQDKPITNKRPSGPVSLTWCSELY